MPLLLTSPKPMRNPFKKRNPYQLTDDLLKANPDAKSCFDLVGSKAALKQYMCGYGLTFTEDSTDEVAKIKSYSRPICICTNPYKSEKPFFDERWHIPFYIRYKLEKKYKGKRRFFRKLFRLFKHSVTLL